MTNATSASTSPKPTNRPTLADLVSGFLVFLIALPLCLGIAAASEFPPIAGVWTAVAGGLICSFISNSAMTIKGPAAGLIVIVLGAVTDLGHDAIPQLPAEQVASLQAEGRSAEEIANVLKSEQLKAGYRYALGVGVVAGVLQVLFGLLRLGTLAELFPMTPVHALLASIGIIIMFKQAYPLVGLKAPGGEAINSVLELPNALSGAVPSVAIIGLVGLAIMVAFSFVRRGWLKKVPAQLVVLAVTIPLGGVLLTESKFLVQIPHVLENPTSAFALPSFAMITSFTSIKYIVLFALIGSLESAVSAKAVDLIDPYKRKTNLNRDLFAVGLANTMVACVGGLPMISEIVRSKANIDNGARTSFANFFHALFLVLAALVLTTVLSLIPTAALAAMLVFTGFRLAHPREFVKTYRIGKEQLAIFLVTIVTVLATDLLIGLFAGIGLKVLFHLYNGMPLATLLRSHTESEDNAGRYRVVVRGGAVFANWLSLKRKLTQYGHHVPMTLDFSEANFIDHTVMEKLHELEADFVDNGGELVLAGLERHVKLSNHPIAARRRPRQTAT